MSFKIDWMCCSKDTTGFLRPNGNEGPKHFRVINIRQKYAIFYIYLSQNCDMLKMCILFKFLNIIK